MNAGLRVIHEDGDRFTVQIRGHSLTVDQPESDGGTDFGPQPTELFVASLASCVAHYGRRFLCRHGLPDQVTVDAEWTMASSPTRVGSISVSVAAPGLPSELEPRFAKVIEHCTVHNTLVIPPNVSINVNEVSRLGRPAASIAGSSGS